MATQTTQTTRNVGMIGQMTVRSAHAYIVYGSVRGLVSEHRIATAAARGLKRDQAGCESQGGYSDASVYMWSEMRGWQQDSEQD